MSASSLTCVTCRVAFANSDLYKEHYKGDWHRYNLKRRVAELPIVASDEFHQRLALHISRKEQIVDVASSCDCCKKHFSSKLTYETHLKSKKHQEALLKNNEILKLSLNDTGDSPQHKGVAVPTKPAAAIITDEGSDSDDGSWEDIDDDEPELGPEDCLFCSYKSSNLIENVKHMTNVHSFFIPDIEFLADLEGLLSYLAEKVSCDNVCLWCNGKGKNFHSTLSVQRHMMDKGHCKILHESETLYEFADFYDYSPSYPDNEETANLDEQVELDVLDDEGYELVLPSGATIGHRSLMRYYRQNLRPTGQQNSKRLTPILAHYRALGWNQTPKEIAVRHARDVKHMQTIRAKQYMKQGIKNNKLHKHIHTQIRW